MNVYLVDGGDYSNYGWSGVYATLDAAMLAYPLPEMRAILGKQTDPTHQLARRGGWQPHFWNGQMHREWWNGFHGDFGHHIHEIPLNGAVLKWRLASLWKK